MRVKVGGRFYRESEVLEALRTKDDIKMVKKENRALEETIKVQKKTIKVLQDTIEKLK